MTAWTEGKAFNITSFLIRSCKKEKQLFKDRSLTELVEYRMLLPQTLDYLLLVLYVLLKLSFTVDYNQALVAFYIPDGHINRSLFQNLYA